MSNNENVSTNHSEKLHRSLTSSGKRDFGSFQTCEQIPRKEGLQLTTSMQASRYTNHDAQMVPTDASIGVT